MVLIFVFVRGKVIILTKTVLGAHAGRKKYRHTSPKIMVFEVENGLKWANKNSSGSQLFFKLF
jgi:hypothetical protein